MNDKLLAYSYILTHEGYPCVFWKDYFNFNLALEGTPNGIAALVSVHEKYAAGSTSILYLGRRSLHHAAQWIRRSAWLDLCLEQSRRPLEWTMGHNSMEKRLISTCGMVEQKDLSRPIDQSTDPDGRGQFFAARARICCVCTESLR